MSRRKQAKPRAVFLKSDEQEATEMAQSLLHHTQKDDKVTASNAVAMSNNEEEPAKSSSSLIQREGATASSTEEKKRTGPAASTDTFEEVDDENDIEAELRHLKEEDPLDEALFPRSSHSPASSCDSEDSIGSDPSLSWNSADETVDEDQISLSPSSCATPNSLITEGNEPEISFTIGPTESTPYSCQFCEKSFPRLSYLKKHEQSHSDQMPFKCDFCQRLFKHKRSRDRHVKLHTGDKKYRCPHCESAFSRSDHLKIHMKTHDNQKPYQCVVCNRGYNTAAALTSHMQNHKKESLHGSTPSPGPFRCLQCTGTFLTGEELQTHVSHHHRPINASTPEKLEGNGNNSSSSLGHKRRSISPRTPTSSPNSSHHGSSTGSLSGGRRIRSTIPGAAATELEHSSSNSLMLPFPSSMLPSKLTCIYCTKESFTSLESLQLHVQAMHGSLLNGELSSSPRHHHLSPIGTPSGVSPTTGENLGSTAGGTGGDGHFTCQFCTMNFPSLPLLHKHSLSVHSLSGFLQAKAKENAFCAQCALAFPNSIAFAEHFLIFHTSSSTSPSSIPASLQQQQQQLAHQMQQMIQSHAAAANKPMQVCSPEPPQMKPTDLSKKSRVTYNGSSSSSSSSYSSCSSIPMPAPNNNESSSRHRNDGNNNTGAACSSAATGDGIKRSTTTTKPSKKLKKSHQPGNHEKRSSNGDCGLTIPSPSLLYQHQHHQAQVSLANALNSPLLQSSVPGSASFGPHNLLCNQCNAGFPDFESFRTHLKSHLEQITHKYSCDKCDSEFESEDQLEAHGMAHYLTTTTEYGCQSCLKLFGKPDELQKHLMDIHAHHLFRCALCKEMFDSKVSIQVHFAVKHSNECKLFRCTTCSTMFRSEVEFQVHVRVAHLRKLSPYRCLLCNATFTNELDLQFHLNTHQKQFRCKFCDEAFHVEFLLDKHMQTHHINGSDGPRASPAGAAELMSPGNCNSSAHNPNNGISSFNNHNTHPKSSGKKSGSGMKSGSNNNHHGQQGKELKCDICDKIIGNELELTSHRKQVHHISITSPLSSAAGSGAQALSNNAHKAHNNSKLKAHQNPSGSGNGISSSGSMLNNTGASHVNSTTTTALSLHCAYCNENCKNRSELENHMKSHQIISSGKHKCNICDEVCPSATLLAEHKLTHCKVISGSSCTGCKQNIMSEESYYLHMKQHCSGSNGSKSNTGGADHHQLPLPCIVCRQTLMTEIEIQMHAKFHTKSYVETNNNNAHMMMVSPNSYGNSFVGSIQCSNCGKMEDKSPFLLNGFNGLQSHICQDCMRSRSSALNPTPIENSTNTSAAKSVRKGRPSGNNSANRLSTSSPPPGNDKANKAKTYQCIKCQMSFNTEDEIQSHVQTHLLNEGSSHECHLCTQVTYFDSPLKLQCHLIEHTFAGCSSFTCYMCSAVFTLSSGLQSHIFEHGLSTKIYDCNQCHLKFYFRAELENHVLASHGQNETDKKKMINSPPNSASLRNNNLHSISDAFLSSFGFDKRALNMKDLLNMANEYGLAQQLQLQQEMAVQTVQQIQQNYLPQGTQMKSNQKKKKFFYRSDDSDEEMMDSQSGRESVGSNTTTSAECTSSKVDVKQEQRETPEVQTLNSTQPPSERANGGVNQESNETGPSSKSDKKSLKAKTLRRRAKRRAKLMADLQSSGLKNHSSSLITEEAAENHCDDDQDEDDNDVNHSNINKQENNNNSGSNRAHQQQHEPAGDEDQLDEADDVDEDNTTTAAGEAVEVEDEEMEVGDDGADNNETAAVRS